MVVASSRCNNIPLQDSTVPNRVFKWLCQVIKIYCGITPTSKNIKQWRVSFIPGMIAYNSWHPLSGKIHSSLSTCVINNKNCDN